jgi:hypothetical protein
MPKHRVNVSGVEGVDLTQLRFRYDKLSASLEEVMGLAGALHADPATGDQMLERRRGQIQDELYAIVKTIAAKESQDVLGASVKARVLLDWCERDRDDVVTQLTVSLCQDVLRVARSSEGGERTG